MSYNSGVLQEFQDDTTKRFTCKYFKFASFHCAVHFYGGSVGRAFDWRTRDQGLIPGRNRPTSLKQVVTASLPNAQLH